MILRAAVILVLALSRFADAASAGSLGVVGGELRDCPSSPNCVSSQASDPARRVEPLAFDGQVDGAMQRLAKAIRSLPRTELHVVGNGYLRAEFTTALFGWVDDVEAFAVPSEGVIHLRSASRVGYWDLGANRRRIEDLRRAFDASRSGEATAPRGGP